MLRTLACVVTLTSALGAQQVHVVDASGGGEFSSVLDASLAAANGDILLIRSGTYTETAFVQGKGLHLVGEGPTRPVLRDVALLGDGVSGTGLLRGLDVRNAPPGPFNGPCLYAEGGGLDLWIEDTRLVGSDGAPGDQAPRAALAAPVRSLTVVTSEIFGGAGADGAVDTPAGEGADALWSIALGGVGLWRSTMAGGPGGAVVDGGNGQGGTGLDLAVYDGGSVVLCDVLAQGGAGGDGCSALAPQGCEGGTGLRAFFSSSPGTAGTALVGGAGGLLDDGTSAPSGEVIVPSSQQAVALAGLPRALDAPPPLRERQPGSLSYTGQTGDLVAVFVSLAPGFLAMGERAGAFHLGPVLAGPLLLTSVGAADGSAQLPFLAPSLEPLGAEGLVLYAQAFVQDAGGAIVLSNPTSLVVVDEAIPAP